MVQDNKDLIGALDPSQRERLHDYSNDYDDEYVNIPSSTSELIFKQYRADNNNIDDIELGSQQDGGNSPLPPESLNDDVEYGNSISISSSSERQQLGPM